MLVNMILTVNNVCQICVNKLPTLLMLLVLCHLDLVHVLHRRVLRTPIHHVLHIHQGMIIHSITDGIAI